jgi:hypothetical protein
MGQQYMNLHNDANALAGLEIGQQLGPLEVTVSAEGNERYWAAAGVDHPLLREGVLYPPIGATLVIMLVRSAIAPGEVLHTGQQLTAHRFAHVDEPLLTTAVVRDRFSKRDRDYVIVDGRTCNARGETVWSMSGTFCAL